MSARIMYLTMFAALLPVIFTSPVLAKEAEIPSSGTVTSYGIFGFDYELDGVKLTSAEWQEDGHGSVTGDITGPEITISGNLNIMRSDFMLNEYQAEIQASSAAVDAGGAGFGSPDYVCDGQTWTWAQTYDNREGKVDGSSKLQVPFSLKVPVPAYNQAQGVEHLYFEIQLDIWQTVYAYETPERKHNFIRLYGQLRIPPSLKAVPKPALIITNGGELAPLKITLTLTDTSTTPPKPIPNAVIQVDAPLPGAEVLTGPSWTGNANWTLKGYFRSATKCPNCDWKQATAEFTNEIYYYLKEPGQMIEVLTNDQGQAELEFFLDFGALGLRVPKRVDPLMVPIRAEYTGTSLADGRQILATAKHVVKMKYLGFIVAITYVQPQEWEWSNSFNDYVTTRQNTAEFPLDRYSHDKGTGKRYGNITGADRVIFTPKVVYSPDPNYPQMQNSDELQSRRLQAGMLFSYGDQIDLDARGLSRLLPVENTDPRYGIKGEPGWVWVTVQFFDGLKGKVGVSGNCGQHSLSFGMTPEDAGWVPTGNAFRYWGAKKIGEYAVSTLHPMVGPVNMVRSTAGFLAWLNFDTPVYLRVMSELHVAAEPDGSARITVREGNPDILTPATGMEGVAIAPGSTIDVSANGEFSSRPSDPAEITRADELLNGLRNLDIAALGLAPIEAEDQPSVTPPAIPATPLPPTEPSSGAIPPSTEAPPAPPEPRTDTRTMMSIRVFDVVFDLRGDWELWPETDEAFPVLANKAIGLYVSVFNLPDSTAEVIAAVGDEAGEPTRRMVAGRWVQWYPLSTNDVEVGGLLFFEEPLPTGKSLYFYIMAPVSGWSELEQEVEEVLTGVRFL